MTTIEVLRAESNRLRSLASKIDAFIATLSGEDGVNELPGLGKADAPTLKNLHGEFAGLTQQAAIQKALHYGPHTTRELFERLNAGGQSFKNTTYVSAVLTRMKQSVHRTDGGKWALTALSAESVV